MLEKFVFRTEIHDHVGTISPGEISEGFDPLHDGLVVRLSLISISIRAEPIYTGLQASLHRDISVLGLDGAEATTPHFIHAGHNLWAEYRY